ncbi:hypothetical protein NOMA109596_19350 [Nocardioides marinus]
MAPTMATTQIPAMVSRARSKPVSPPPYAAISATETAEPAVKPR